MTNKTLPKGWIQITLNLLSSVITKGTTPTSYGLSYTKTGIRFIKIENLDKNKINNISITHYISKTTHDFLKRSQLKEHDVLFSIAGTIGKTAIVEKCNLPSNVNQAIAIIRCGKHIDPRFLRSFLNSSSSFNVINKKKRGVGLINVSLSDIKDLSILLPPLNEQKRITSKIESIFAQIDMMEKYQSSVLEMLDKLKTSVLKCAFDGKLVPNDLNDAPISDLKKFRIKQIDLINWKKAKLPKNWVLSTIEDVITTEGLFNDGDWVESKDQDPNGNIKLIQLADIGVYNFKSKSNRFLTSEKSKMLNCTQLQNNDILVARMPDPLGRACLFSNNGNKCVTVVDVAIIRIGKNNCDSKWLMYIINSPEFKNNVYALQSGTTRMRISKKNLGKIIFPVPPLNEQKRITSKIESIFDKINAIVKNVDDTIQFLHILKQSVLKQAFEGKLVSQDPNDESVEMLLEKI